MADTLNQKLNRAIDQIKVIDDKTKTKLKGKTYTTVAARNEIFRNQFFTDLCMTTKLIENSQDVVICHTEIKTHEGLVLADGFAEEIRGSTHILKTSALEVCETSSIGRALANLGLHGGEYGSANEVGKAMIDQEKILLTEKVEAMQKELAKQKEKQQDKIVEKNDQQVTAEPIEFDFDSPPQAIDSEKVSKEGVISAMAKQTAYWSAWEKLAVQNFIACPTSKMLKDLWNERHKKLYELCLKQIDIIAHRVKSDFDERLKALSPPDPDENYFKVMQQAQEKAKSDKAQIKSQKERDPQKVEQSIFGDIPNFHSTPEPAKESVTDDEIPF